MRKRTSVDPNLVAAQALNEPWIIHIDGEIVLVDRRWVKRLTQKQARHIARATFRHMYYYDSPEYLALYDEGILSVRVDQLQDTETLRHLSLGIELLQREWPVTVSRAARFVLNEKNKKC
jgi:hypothetical protein